MQAVLFAVGKDRYGLPIEDVRQVVAAPVLTPLVTAPAGVRGLFNLRGEIVPLLDVATLLGLGPGSGVDSVVVVNTEHGPAGLAVNGVPKRAELGTPVGISELAGTTGTFLVDGQVVVLLDLEGVLDAMQRGHDRARTG